jgi:hypothetical protein
MTCRRRLSQAQRRRLRGRTSTTPADLSAVLYAIESDKTQINFRYVVCGGTMALYETINCIDFSKLVVHMPILLVFSFASRE